MRKTRKGVENQDYTREASLWMFRVANRDFVRAAITAVRLAFPTRRTVLLRVKRRLCLSPETQATE